MYIISNEIEWRNCGWNIHYFVRWNKCFDLDHYVLDDPALQAWNEDTIKMCLYLYLGLLPNNHKLIHQ